MRKSTATLLLAVAVVLTSCLNFGCANVLLTRYEKSQVDTFSGTAAHRPAVDCVNALTSNRNQVLGFEGAKKGVTIVGGSVTLLGGVAAAILGAGQSAEIVQPPGDPPPPVTAQVDESTKVATIVAASITAVAGIATLVAGLIPPDQEGIDSHRNREKHYVAAWDIHWETTSARIDLEKAKTAEAQARDQEKKAKATAVAAEDTAQKAKVALDKAKAALDASPQDAALKAKFNEAAEISAKATAAAASAATDAEAAAAALAVRAKELKEATDLYDRTTSAVGQSFTRCVSNSNQTDLWSENRRKTLTTQ